MDKISLAILGLGSRSTTFYITELNRMYNEKNGGFSTCPFILLNTNFNEINSLLPNTSKQLSSIIQAYLSELEKLDCTHALVPNITLHETIDNFNCDKILIHPIHLTILKIKQKRWTKIVLFGSLFTMQSDYISRQFTLNGIEVILPTQEEMKVIDDLRKHIYLETETLELVDIYQLLIEKYSKSHAVIISCTELSVLDTRQNTNVVDMARVQIEAAIAISNSH